jgi:peptidoglycan-associated lipoprotein
MGRSLRSASLFLSILSLVLLLTGCPKQPSPTGAVPAPGGGAAMPPPREFASTAELKDAHFEFDKYSIRPEDKKVLDTDATWLKAHANDLILIEGHGDERGTNEYNLALGERRAKAAMTYLVGQGVQASRFTLISYGKERPTCAEHTEGCWAKNRRAHFLVKLR